ncbi:MAG TPA: Gfo/Idh/MocA family oxidoreductase [Sedimentisphaerales bacterium]|nr:Gfo/Idh/MocA family oxidoreductase [Sedimentisphaerales bacterium]
MSNQGKKTSRRRFLQGTAGAAAAFTIAPHYVLGGRAGAAPSDRLNIAHIGVGGRGGASVNGTSSENFVALCDVDTRRAAANFEKYPSAKRYTDFRKMLDEMDSKIDAVTVSTPDHTHAIACMDAIRRGKHVYCEKPLAHSVHEIRELMRAAREHKVVTQLGNQGHSFDTIRMFCEWIWDGAIGNVHTIHCGCRAVNSGIDQLSHMSEKEEIPPEVDWNLWLGPARQRPYHSFYMPGRWRGWVPFGNGTIGDWTCHVVDPVFWALDLGAPKTLRAEVDEYDPKTQGDAFPRGDIITFEFAAKGKRGPVTLLWHSGTKKIPPAKELEPGRKPVETGAYVYGDKGVITYGSHGAGSVRIIPEPAMKAYARPDETIPRVKSHHDDWLRAIREGRKAGSDFSYGGPLTEIAMLGVIALKMPGMKLDWDGPNARFTNCDEANQYVRPPYRDGWTL